MLADVLDHDWRVKAFFESSSLNRRSPRRRPWSIKPSSRWDLRLGPLDDVAATLASQRAPLVVAKPLVESQRTPELLDGIERSAAVWTFRNYRDVSRSNIALFTPDVNRVNLEPILRNDRTNWRGEVVPDDVRHLVERHYRPDIGPLDGGALFWYARNRLFFELGLDREPRVLPLRYETLVSEPERSMRAVYGATALDFPGPRLVEGIHPRSVGLGSSVSLDPDIEQACERLWVELCARAAERLQPRSS